MFFINRHAAHSPIPADTEGPLRAPRGYGLHLMMEFSEESGIDDIESVASAWTIGGRGSRSPGMEFLKLALQRGRGGFPM